MSAWFDNKYKEEEEETNLTRRIAYKDHIYSIESKYLINKLFVLLNEQIKLNCYWKIQQQQNIESGDFLFLLAFFCFVLDSLNYYFNKRISRNFNFCFEVNTLCYHFHDSLIDHLIFFLLIPTCFCKTTLKNVNNKWHLY